MSGCELTSPARLQTTPNTIAAMKPKDRSAASTFSRTTSSIVASNCAAALCWQLVCGTGTPDPRRSWKPKLAAKFLPSKIFFALRGTRGDLCDGSDRAPLAPGTHWVWFSSRRLGRFEQCRLRTLSTKCITRRGRLKCRRQFAPAPGACCAARLDCSYLQRIADERLQRASPGSVRGRIGRSLDADAGRRSG